MWVSSRRLWPLHLPHLDRRCWVYCCDIYTILQPRVQILYGLSTLTRCTVRSSSAIVKVARRIFYAVNSPHASLFLPWFFFHPRSEKNNSTEFFTLIPSNHFPNFYLPRLLCFMFIFLAQERILFPHTYISYMYVFVSVWVGQVRRTRRFPLSYYF